MVFSVLSVGVSSLLPFLCWAKRVWGEVRRVTRTRCSLLHSFRFSFSAPLHCWVDENVETLVQEAASLTAHRRDVVPWILSIGAPSRSSARWVLCTRHRTSLDARRSGTACATHSQDVSWTGRARPDIPR